jgi:hypothetical protein
MIGARMISYISDDIFVFSPPKQSLKAWEPFWDCVTILFEFQNSDADEEHTEWRLARRVAARSGSALGFLISFDARNYYSARRRLGLSYTVEFRRLRMSVTCLNKLLLEFGWRPFGVSILKMKDIWVSRVRAIERHFSNRRFPATLYWSMELTRLRQKPRIGARRAKKKETLSVGGVGSNCEIASLQDHIADLAFTKILKHPVIAGPIIIAVGQTLFSGDDDYERALWGSDNAALLLTAKLGVDVGSTVINFAFFEAPAHANAPLDRNLRGSLP